MDVLAVLGLASLKPAAYCFHPVTGDLLYCAGAMIVVYSLIENRQKTFLVNPKGHPYNCLCISQDGKDIITAEALSN